MFKVNYINIHSKYFPLHKIIWSFKITWIFLILWCLVLRLIILMTFTLFGIWMLKIFSSYINNFDIKRIYWKRREDEEEKRNFGYACSIFIDKPRNQMNLIIYKFTFKNKIEVLDYLFPSRFNFLVWKFNLIEQ